MTVCQCCGQLITEQALEFYADEALVACLEKAGEIKQIHGAAEVDIAHIAAALAQTHAARRVLERYGIAADRFGESIAIDLSRHSARYVSNNPNKDFTTDAMELLRRAQTMSSSGGGDTVTLSSLVEVLLHRVSDLEGAQCVAFAQLSATTREMNRHENRVSSPSFVELERDQNTAAYFERAREHGSAVNRVAGDQHEHSRRTEPATIRRATVSDRVQASSDRSTHFDYDADQKFQSLDLRFSALEKSLREVREDMAANESMNGTRETVSSFSRQLKVLEARLQSIEQLFNDSRTEIRDRDRERREHSRTIGEGVTGTSSHTKDNPQSDYLQTSVSERVSSRSSSRSKSSDRSSNRRGSKSRRTRRARSAGTRRRTYYGLRNRAKSRVRRSRMSRRYFQSKAQPNRSATRDQSGIRSRRSGVSPTSGLPAVTHSVRDAQSRQSVAEESNEKRFYLSMGDPVENAPSIGPRTAERLAPHGIHTVRDLMAADVADLAEAVAARHITAQRIEDWQMQARLVCTIPWLRGTHAQLLVGAGYTTPGDISDADKQSLCSDILKFASNKDGQRILRSGPAPDMEKIVKWSEFASQAELERAA